MNAVATEAQPLSVELKPTRERRRRLVVRRDNDRHFWAGIYDGSGRSPCHACAACDDGDIHIVQFSFGDISLSVGGGHAQFEISRAEADQLIAAFGFEVRKL